MIFDILKFIDMIVFKIKLTKNNNFLDEKET